MNNLPAQVSELSREEKLALLARLARERSRVQEPEEAPRSYPLAFAQQRFWFLDQLDPGSYVDIVFRALRLSGPLDLEAFERALGELVRRHAALRTRFPMEDGEPRQVVEPELPSSPLLSVVDLCGPGSDEGLEEILPRAADFAREEARRPFDLANGPLLRATLLRLGPQEHALLLAVHHIVCDGWSLGLLLRDLTALYGAFTAGRPSPLPELRARYGDFARWQRERLQGEALAQELAFWRGRLEGTPPLLELPSDHPRSQAPSARGDVLPFAVPGPAAERLKTISQQAGATPFMALLALFDVLLLRCTGQEDFVVGVPVANRNRTEFENVVGCFSSNLLVRARVRCSMSFRELLAGVRAEALAVFSHSDLPFEKLVEELQPERNLSYNPLFQVMFALQNAAAGTLSMGEVKLSPLAVERGLAKLDLTLEMAERDGVLAGYFEYNVGLFERATIERMARHLLRLLESAVADPERRIGELPWLDPEERRQLEAWSAGPAQPDRLLPVHHAFEESARRAPLADAVVWGGERLPYAELDRRANRLARHLRRLGVGPEVRVGLCVERSFEMAVGLLAVLKAGGAYVPLDPAYPRERLSYLVEDSGMRVLLTTARLAPRLPAVELLLELDPPAGEHFWNGEPADPPAIEIDPGSTAYIIYTSGSTGRPKGVPVPHRALANHAAATAARYGLGPEDRVLQFASLSFDIAGEEIFPTWLAGAALVPRPAVLFPSFSELAEMIASQGITVANLPTPYWHEWTAELSRTDSRPPAPLRLVIVGTEQASAGRLDEWLSKVGAGVRWMNAYGPTEATITATVHEGPIDPGRLRVAVGTPLAGVRAHVLDEVLQLVPQGISGELCLGGAGIARGYLNRPEATAASFVPDPYASEPGLRLYRTGDRARFLPSGEIELLGRGDDQVKIRGFRVEPGEVEAVLAGHPGLRDAAVVARDDGPAGIRLVGYAAAGEGAPDVEELRAFLRERLPEHMLPAALVLLPELPLTPSGKVDRRALPAPAPELEEGEAPVTPQGPVEEVMAAIWGEVLRRDRIGARESFFAAGGHSLLATQVISRVREALGVELPLRAIFEAPTIAGLAEAVEAARRSSEGLQVPPVTRVPRTGDLPCSFAQQRLWVLDRLHPDSPMYNMPLALRLRGRLDEAALESTLAEIVRRHESLRTTFAAVAGQPVQVIAPPAPLPLPRADLSELAEPEAAAQRFILEDSLRPFDLARGPLLRCSLLRLGGEDHLLLVNMHHIVSDGWSMGVFLRELATLYGAFLQGEPSPLPELPVQYADFASWQRQWLQGEVLERQIDFWRSRLAGAPVAIELPTDRPRPPVQTARGGRARFDVSSELLRSLRAVARNRRATLFMTLLAGFNVLLSRLSGQDDIVLGTPVAGRARGEVEGIIGFFANTLVLRADLSGLPTSAEIVEQVRERALDAYTHQDLPFERLVEELQPQRHLSHNPIFQVLFVLHHAGAQLDLPGLGVSHLSVDSGTSRFDLLLSLAEAGEELRGFFEYNADLFDAATAERLAGRFSRLLAGMAADSEAPAAHLPWLTQAEQAELLSWNDTREDLGPEVPLHRLFEAQAAAAPDAIAVAFESAHLTYRQLDLAAARLAARLRSSGVGRESLVGVAMERSLELVVALLGILKAGAAYVPLDPAYPRERLAYMLEDSGVRILLSQERLTGSLPPFAGRLVLLDGIAAKMPAEDASEMPAEEAGETSIEVGSDGLAYMIYTSGSTGRPKGALNTHGGIRNRLVWMQREYGLTGGDAVLQKTPFSFDVSVWEFFWPLITGARLVLARPGGHQEPAYLVQLIAGEGITTVHFVPSMLQVFLEQKDLALCSGLRRVICSGEALPHELQQRFFERMPGGVELHNLYGPTEAAVDVTFWQCAPEAPRVPIGRPVSNTRIHLLDREMQPVPAGVAGELYIAGVQLARGYHGRPELTAERFVPDPAGDPGGRLYRTGDLARWLADGTIDYLGRVDFQVKVRGFRIELGEIESALAEHPGVREAAVLARADDAAAGLRLVAYVVPAGESEPAVAALRAFLKERLPEYMVPGHVLVLDALPLTPSGKVDRKALPAPDGNRQAASELVPPAGPVQERIAAIWTDLLRVDRVGAHDNFFESGGHSLLAMQVLSRVQESFGVELPLRSFFEAPTVAGLAQAIFENEVREADADLLAELLANLEQQAIQGEGND